jgi:hypothetical protein
LPQLLCLPAGTPDEKLLLGVCGIRFKLGQRSSELPPVAEDAHLIPEPYCMEVVFKPRARPPRLQIARFKLYTVEDVPEPPPEVVEAVSPGKGKPKTPPKAAAKPAAKGKGKVEEPEKPALNPAYKERQRWVVPASSALDLVVLFQV